MFKKKKKNTLLSRTVLLMTTIGFKIWLNYEFVMYLRRSLGSYP